MEGSIKTAPLEQQLTREQAEQQVFYRLTALWAMCEAFLGGVLHAFKLPGTGLFVGGAAVLCISLIAWHCPKRSAILKATVLVILIKGMLSPHSPFGAYLAVAIQGGLGYLLFWSKNYFRLSCFTLGIVTQLQSALQRLVVLVVVFGGDVYSIANGFVNYILKKAGFAEGEYILYIIIVYIGLHALMGVAVGWLAGKLPEMIRKAQDKGPGAIGKGIKDYTAVNLPAKRKRKYKKLQILTAVLLTGSLIIAYMEPAFFQSKIAWLLLRAVLILTCWYFILMPTLLWGLKKWAANKKKVLHHELQIVLNLIPALQHEITYLWESSHQLRFFPRLLYMVKTTALAFTAPLYQKDHVAV